MQELPAVAELCDNWETISNAEEWLAVQTACGRAKIVSGFQSSTATQALRSAFLTVGNATS
eukprot:4473724-Amphidinium_carterae.1